MEKVEVAATFVLSGFLFLLFLQLASWALEMLVDVIREWDDNQILLETLALMLSAAMLILTIFILVTLFKYGIWYSIGYALGYYH